ncbi:MAG: hypothetical protein H8E41_09950 [Desulfobulbaceae bacterium]|uniref:Recombination-associated protein RdgC n=1 Tax=Candidatus Desulfobia pelagia TaxID=2841692 RepID=A0A8J6TG40_9BACT|nr:hypothetical protein [Candidatus Desulfobia pelagia]
MDLVDLISEKRFLGQDFLTWLWYKSDERGGTVFLPGTGDIQLVFEKHMLLEYGEGDSFEKIVCQGLQAELREARTGLRMGKKLEQTRIHLVLGEYQWFLTLKGSMLQFRNVKLPKTMTGTEESDDPHAVEGRLLDRIGLLETATRTVDELFRLFLEIRVSSDWQDELAKVSAWVQKSK